MKFTYRNNIYVLYNLAVEDNKKVLDTDKKAIFRVNERGELDYINYFYYQEDEDVIEIAKEFIDFSL